MLDISVIKNQNGVRLKRTSKYVLSGRLKHMLSDINYQCGVYGISGERYNAFMACCSTESKYFKIFDIKDVMWSVTWMARTFPGYINSATCEYYRQNKELLLNRFYSSHNGNKEEGDGWKYRPRGIIKICGRNDYDKLGYYLKSKEFVDDPDILGRDYAVMIKAACVWFNAVVYDTNTEIMLKSLSIEASMKNFKEIICFYEKCQKESHPNSDGLIGS